MYGYSEKSALSSIRWDSWNRTYKYGSLPLFVEYGLHVWRKVVMVSQHGSLYMATKHLLDIYYIVRLLLVYGETTIKAWSDGVWRRTDCNSGDACCHASEQSGVWRVDLYWLLYVVISTATWWKASCPRPTWTV